MIETKELRLGNLVYFTNHDSTAFRVTKIENSLIGVAGGPHFQDSSNLAIPIPLDNEWLARLGFEEKLNHGLRAYTIGNMKIDMRSGIGQMILITNGTFMGSCAYVHQLQNLYFALTGEELEVKA